VKIWGVNDQLKDISVKLKWSLARFDGLEVKSGEQDVELSANSSTFITELDFRDEIGENPDHVTYRKDSFEKRRQYYLAYTLSRGTHNLSSNVSFFVPQKYVALNDPGLKYEVEEENGRWIVTVSTERFAAYVELGVKDGYARFSDNYFHLMPGVAKKIIVVDSEVSDERFMKRFYVKSLVDSYR
jgi:hypothetical protein